MADTWLVSALWIGLALVSAFISIGTGVAVALVEIMVGAVAGNTIGLIATPWVTWLAGFGAILLTFLAGTEVEVAVIRRNLALTVGIGVLSFLIPYLGVFLVSNFMLGWTWEQAQIAGIAMSTTSVAVVYAVMVETGLNETELGKIILAACFITDLGTVVMLGVVFAHYDYHLAIFGVVTGIVLAILPTIVGWFFLRIRPGMSEPEVKLIILTLFGLGGLAVEAGSEAVLPAYLLGMALAPTLLLDPEMIDIIRIIALTLLTPFFFLKAGALVDWHAIIAGAGLILVFFAFKMATKFAGVLPVATLFGLTGRDGIFTTLLMSTGLTFGTISAQYGLTHGIIDQRQYTILVIAGIASAVVPTLIAMHWFRPLMRRVTSPPGVAPDTPAAIGRVGRSLRNRY